MVESTLSAPGAPLGSTLDAQTPTPIAQLSPGLPDRDARVIDGVVTITWPYSIVTRSAAFILAEHDFRLRHARGQLRLEFHGPVGQKLTDAGIGGGDSLRISLDGAQWEPHKAQTRVPGTILEWQLKFTTRLLVRIQRAEDQQIEVLDLNLEDDATNEDELLATLTPHASSPPMHSSLFVTHPVSTPPTKSPNFALPAKRPASSDLETTEFASPAFLKRARVSYGSLFEDGFDIFDEDVARKQKKKTKRSRFSMGAREWKYTSRSPSPEPEAPEEAHELDSNGGDVSDHAESDEAAPPIKSYSMVDESSQTQDTPDGAQMHQRLEQASTAIPLLPPSSPTPIRRAGQSKNHPEDGALSNGATGGALNVALGQPPRTFGGPPNPLADRPDENSFSRSSFGDSVFSVEHTTTASSSSIPVFNDSLAEAIYNPFQVTADSAFQPHSELALEVPAALAIPPRADKDNAAAEPIAENGNITSFTNAVELAQQETVQNPFTVNEPFPHAGVASSDRVEEEMYGVTVYPEIDSYHAEADGPSHVSEDLHQPTRGQDEHHGAPTEESAGEDEKGEDGDESTDYEIETRDPPPRLPRQVESEDEKEEEEQEEEYDEEEGYDEEGYDEHYEEDEEEHYDEDDEEQYDEEEEEEEEYDEEEGEEAASQIQPASRDPVVISLLSDSEDEDEPAVPTPPVQKAIITPAEPERPDSEEEQGEGENDGPEDAEGDEEENVPNNAEAEEEDGSDDAEEEHEDAIQKASPEQPSKSDGSAHETEGEHTKDYSLARLGKQRMTVDDAILQTLSGLPPVPTTENAPGSVQKDGAGEGDGDAEEDADDVAAAERNLAALTKKFFTVPMVDFRALRGPPVHSDSFVDNPLFGHLRNDRRVVEEGFADDPLALAMKAMAPEHPLTLAMKPLFPVERIDDAAGMEDVDDGAEVEIQDEIKSQPDVDMDAGDLDESEDEAEKSTEDIFMNESSLAQGEIDAVSEPADVPDEDGTRETPEEVTRGAAESAIEDNAADTARETKEEMAEEVASATGKARDEEPIEEPIEELVEERVEDAADQSPEAVTEMAGDVATQETSKHTTVQNESFSTENEKIMDSEAAARPSNESVTRSVKDQQLPTPADTQLPVTEATGGEIARNLQQQQGHDDDIVDEDDIAASQQIIGEYLQQRSSPTLPALPPAPPSSTSASFKGHQRKRSDTISETGRRTRSQTKQHQDEGSTEAFETPIPRSSPRSHRRSSKSLDKTNEAPPPAAASVETTTSSVSSKSGGDKASPLLQRSFRITRSRGTAEGTDPSIVIAKAGGASSPRRTPEHTPSRPITLRVTRSMEDIAEAGIKEGLVMPPASVRSARLDDGASSQGTRSPAPSGTPLTPSTTMQLQLNQDHRYHSRASESSASTGLKSPSIAASLPETETITASELRIQLQRDLRNTLPDNLALNMLRTSLNKTADFIAIAVATPAPPYRPKNGPRDYMLELLLVDPTSAPKGVHVAHIFRPHQQSLPVVREGDVVLLRGMSVVAVKDRGFGLRVGDASAWAVFDEQARNAPRNGDVPLPQIKGPPVEVMDAEVQYAMGLSRWWKLLDEATKGKIARAAQKMLASG